MRHQVEFFHCDCKAPEHTLRFDLHGPGKDDDMPLLCATVYLHQHKSWRERIIPALKYLLNLAPCKGGHFDEWILESRNDGLARLSGLISDYGAELAAWKERNGVNP